MPTIEQLKAEEKASAEKFAKENSDRAKAIADHEEKERLAAEKAAADKKAKDEADAAKAASDRLERIKAHPAGSVLMEVSQAFRAQGGFNDRATAGAFASVADILEGRADALSAGHEAPKAKAKDKD